MNKLVRGMWCGWHSRGGGGREAPAHPPAQAVASISSQAVLIWLSAHSRQEKRPGSLQRLKPRQKCPEACATAAPGMGGSNEGPSPGLALPVCWFWFWGSQCAFVWWTHLSWAEAEVALGVQDHSSGQQWSSICRPQSPGLPA